ncbi:ABC transporter ATP-binding protein [Bacillus chungangensis]|uniref:ATP-binding cassette subfamily B protein AbcA/BmrA n=1 Tax=Bacillus chungangensis TaxID=587633 RepID=A0ABT9WVA0_9BACI|nr:ABC transporter ATP-binding protein [Bacillus chungangensis]MDQ0177233.1 ATP-binding cassette subfamily B protein AbcA/BmrA [Bacillus chungangensis]
METKNEINKGQFKQFLDLLKLGKPSKWVFLAAIILSLFETAAGLVVPLFTRNLIDVISTSGIEITMILLLIGAFIVQIISGGVSYYLMTYIGETFVAKIREKLWNQILGLPIPYFDRHQSGETMSRITQDTNTIKTLITNHFVTLISGIATVVGSIMILLLLDWKMTLILLIAVPVSTMILGPLGRKMYQISKLTQDEMANFSANLGRVLSDIRLVKSYNGQPLEQQKGKKGIQQLFRFGLREAKIQAVISPFMTTIMMLVLVVIVGYGGARVAAGDLSAGTLVAILIYLFQIIVPFTQLASFFTAFQKAMGATERIQSLLRLDSEEQNKKEIADFSKTISFNKVTFAYEQGKKPILKKLDFQIHPGETVAFVGPSGAGKTTIFSLLERFYSLTEGSIQIGETNIAEISLMDWRKAIGYVSQESPIMSGTIKDNICYGLQRDVSDEEVREAAALANADGFIEQLSNGYETEVGERGIKLSGGQRQRIAIARALLRNPKLLLLDEATSNLDSESEVLVQHALKNLMAGRTTLIIAHRLSTVIEADNIIVVQDGSITGKGTHQSLMETHGLYQKLVNQQLQGKVFASE